MDQGKHNNSDSSSSENDPHPEKSNDDNAGVGRSYECTYCKRGFTNAQALGGHMNIHRKDKAKAKQRNNQEDPSIHNSKLNVNSRYFPQISAHDQQQGGYYRLLGTQVNYQVYLPSSNPSFQIGNSESTNPPVWRRPEHFEYQQNLMDENLSLRIGLPPPSVEDHGDGNEKENEVDLELRLGHDP